MRKCKDCDNLKELIEFSAGSRRCKICTNIKNKKDYDPEKNANKIKLLKLKDPEKWKNKRRQYTKRYADKNRIEINEKSRIRQRKRREKGLIKIDRSKRTENSRKFRDKYPEKKNAQYLLTSKLNRKLINRPLNCQVCIIECKVEGHHHDYSKPFDVVWCCKKCHGDLHVIIRRDKLGQNR